MNHSILIALKDSKSSQVALDYFANLPFHREKLRITLLYIFRKPSASEEMMGEHFVKEEPSRFLNELQTAKDMLVQKGFNPDNIEIKLANEPYPTVADGIIEEFKKGDFDMLVIGRKKKSKAEEFVLGDISVKLVRALERAAVLVVEFQ